MGFCGWPVTVPTSAAAEWAAADPDVRARAEHLAGLVLWTLTGQVFGTCDVTVRPCFSPVESVTPGAAFWPGLLNGAPGASGPCGCSDGCTEVGFDRVALPGPVADIIEVMIDGITIAPATYRLENRRWLHRVDGQWWPTHQNMHAPDDGAGAFTVRYMRGLPVPDPGPIMGGRLAVQFLRGMTGGECALPDRATSVSRQGVTVELADIREWFTNGVTGVEDVDLWIMSVNPHKSKRPARITSPEAIRRQPLVRRSS